VLFGEVRIFQTNRSAALQKSINLDELNKEDSVLSLPGKYSSFMCFPVAEMIKVAPAGDLASLLLD
jgi:hypothetical protein